MPSHGSLTKAMKVRGQNPINWKRQTRKSKKLLPYKHFKKHKNPRTGKRRRYNRWVDENVTVPFLVKMGVLRPQKKKRGKYW